jgi:Lactoylglutathione lyase and related lyases
MMTDPLFNWAGFHHVALVTSDLNATIQFYKDVPGMHISPILRSANLYSPITMVCNWKPRGQSCERLEVLPHKKNRLPAGRRFRIIGSM